LRSICASLLLFHTIIQQFAQQGEKTGWTYIRVPERLAAQLFPNNKKSFRVKGRLDDHPIKAVALLPMGEGDFILAINGSMRKAIRKRKGDSLVVHLERDREPLRISKDLLDCLKDEPRIQAYFKGLTRSHQGYFSKWIESAKTEKTKAHRIAQVISAMAKKWDYGQMLRSLKKK
jgi:hypothetical protein